MTSNTGFEKSEVPETFFAPAARANPHEIAVSVERMSRNPVVDAILHASCESIAVLDAHRQIIALNDEYLKYLGVADAHDTLGLRPGEAMSCAHAKDHPGGCGTSRFCSSCGAAVAIVAAFEGPAAIERECVLTIQRDGTRSDASFVVRASPLTIEGVPLVLLSLHDVSADKRRAALESAFFHDINNTIQALYNSSELAAMSSASETHHLLGGIHHLCMQLAKEVTLQRTLLTDGCAMPKVNLEPVALAEITASLRLNHQNHPALRGKSVDWSKADGPWSVLSDRWLLMRVLGNMLINAAEATPPGGTVRIAAKGSPDAVVFSVWNATHIPESIAPRVFQRYFSTKGGLARGQGTFIMKLLAESYLHAHITFSTSATTGTIFELRLPTVPPK